MLHGCCLLSSENLYRRLQVACPIYESSQGLLIITRRPVEKGGYKPARPLSCSESRQSREILRRRGTQQQLIMEIDLSDEEFVLPDQQLIFALTLPEVGRQRTVGPSKVRAATAADNSE